MVVVKGGRNAPFGAVPPAVRNVRLTSTPGPAADLDPVSFPPKAITVRPDIRHAVSPPSRPDLPPEPERIEGGGGQRGGGHDPAQRERRSVF